jgi:hypothetical protein
MATVTIGQDLPITIDTKYMENRLFRFEYNEAKGTLGFRECTGDYMKIPSDGMGGFSDGYHTFNELYNHRAVLFAALCESWNRLAWKSKWHSDGTMFGEMFIAGIDLPTGRITYHIDKKWWPLFNTIKEIDKAPEWDGHTPEDVLQRLTEFLKVTGHGGGA